ncbi:hypothetical protein Esti_003494 [Eimeria stiedai]
MSTQVTTKEILPHTPQPRVILMAASMLSLSLDMPLEKGLLQGITTSLSQLVHAAPTTTTQEADLPLMETLRPRKTWQGHRAEVKLTVVKRRGQQTRKASKALCDLARTLPCHLRCWHSELLDCIKVKSTQERKNVIENICKSMKGKLLSACLSLRDSARMLSHGIEQNCKNKPMSHMQGMMATPFDFTRLSDVGTRQDFKVEGFDGFYITEHTAVYYGEVLDRKDILEHKRKRRSTRWLSRKNIKIQAIRDYGTAEIVALARPPHVDPVFVKAIMKTLSLDDCPPDSNMGIYDLFSESTRPFQHPKRLCSRVRGSLSPLPPAAPEPTPDERNNLLRAIQQAAEAHAFQYTREETSRGEREASSSQFSRFSVVKYDHNPPSR